MAVHLCERTGKEVSWVPERDCTAESILVKRKDGDFRYHLVGFSDLWEMVGELLVLIEEDGVALYVEGEKIPDD